MKTIEEVVAEIERSLQIEKEGFRAIPDKNSPMAGMYIGAISVYEGLLEFVRSKD